MALCDPRERLVGAMRNCKIRAKMIYIYRVFNSFFHTDKDNFCNKNSAIKVNEIKRINLWLIGIILSRNYSCLNSSDVIDNFDAI